MTTHNPSTDPAQDEPELDDLNEQLNDSIGRCRIMLHDLRSRLDAANSNGADDGESPANDTQAP